MENLNDIKNELKRIQENFNPAKSTYRIIDKVINDDMSIDQMLKSLYSIKGIEKYPEDIKEKYFEIVESLQKLLIVKRKREKQEQENKKTKELKDIIASIEEREVKDKKEEPFKKEPAPERIKQNLVKLQEKSIKEAKENLSKKEDLKKEEKKEVIKQGDAKDKKIFKLLIVMIAISIILGVLLILFL